MNFKNPTSVEIGMSGSFVGIRYRVVGRVLMGVEEGGQIYTWNEFNLVGENKQGATLVYENAENGPEWKLFTLFEPQNPMSVQEAATKKSGDSVNLDGAQMRVTLVDESKVYHIEGVAPEEVEVGDVAKYFNAESPGKMVVASWTGDEIEFYHGMNLPGRTVSQAFGLLRDVPQNASQNSFNLRSNDDAATFNWTGKIVGVAFVAIIAFSIYSFFKADQQWSGPEKKKLATSPLGIGGRGNLEGKAYRVTGESVVEIAQVGQRFDRREYNLSDDDGNSALLIFGEKNRPQDWILFTSFEPVNSITPQQAAAFRVGDNIKPEATAIKVTELFQARLQHLQGELPGATNGDVFYGLNANDKNNRLLVRWNASGVTFYRGKKLDEKTVFNAFKVNSPSRTSW